MKALRLTLLILLLLGSIVFWGHMRIVDRHPPTYVSVSAADHEAQMPLMRGAFHVHSAQSHDSELSLDTIAAAAAEVGLDFVILTDHNAQLADSVQRKGVWLIAGAELSTPFGHLISLGASDLVPKKKRRDLDIHTQVRRLGGFSIVAHPGDPKRDWQGPFRDMGGIEIANISSSARRQAGPVFVGLLDAVLAWPINRPLAMAQLYDRDQRALSHWDDESDPSIAGICGVDAHGLISLRDNLRAWIVTIHSPRPPQNLPAAVIEHIARGAFHCHAGIIGDAPRLFFGAELENGEMVQSGAKVATQKVKALRIEGPEGTPTPLLVLYRNGSEVYRSQTDAARYAQPGEGTYRLEVRTPLPGLLFGERWLTTLYSGRIQVQNGETEHESGHDAQPSAMNGP